MGVYGKDLNNLKKNLGYTAQKTHFLQESLYVKDRESSLCRLIQHGRLVT